MAGTEGRGDGAVEIGGQLDLVDAIAGAAPAAPLVLTAPQAGAARPVGRPKGAMNKRSRDWQMWIAASGKRHPLEFLIELFQKTPEELAREMKIYEVVKTGKDTYEDRLATGEAFKRQIEAAGLALPYLEQKLPMAVEDVSEGKRPVIIVGQLTPQQRDQATARYGFRLANGDGKSQAIQHVIERAVVKSDDAKSEDAT